MNDATERVSVQLKRLIRSIPKLQALGLHMSTAQPPPELLMQKLNDHSTSSWKPEVFVAENLLVRAVCRTDSQGKSTGSVGVF